jgi:hypothetical protein
MKKLLAVLLLMVIASPALAEGGSTVAAFKVCDAKLATQNTTTDCSVIETGAFDAVSVQFQCTSAAGAPSVTLNWVGGLDASKLGIPSGLSAIATTITAETVSVPYAVSPAVTSVGTVRITENNAQADTLCTVWITGRY